MIKTMIRRVTEHFHLNGIVTGEFSKMKVNGMHFEIWSFHAEGLGHVSAITARGILGLKQMDTLIINPTERDMPLLSCHRVHALGNDTLIYGLYDTVLEKTDLCRLEAVKDKFRYLPDHELGKRWYDEIKLAVSLSKKGKKQLGADFDQCAMEYLKAYLEDAREAAYCDPAGKKAKASYYVDGLLEKGSPFADIFRKGLGQESAEVLFRNVLFGTGW